MKNEIDQKYASTPVAKCRIEYWSKNLNPILLLEMKLFTEFKEIIYLSIFFTVLAVYFDIYGEGHVLSFIINHVIALLIALIVSRVIYRYITGKK
jgi:hypothetical protein